MDQPERVRLLREEESSDQFFLVRIVPKRSRLSSAVTSVRSRI